MRLLGRTSSWCWWSAAARDRGRTDGAVALPLTAGAPVSGGLGALAWVALKVGALSYGGGFVIIPLMQLDAVITTTG